jgi:NAD(P)H dehydrogenase (quinone)
MKALLVHAHSEGDSYVTAMRDAIAATLEASGHIVEHSDLYAMNFNPVLSAADFPNRREPDHLVYALEQRHGYESGTLAPDILLEIEKVLAADLLVFTFPLFWFSVPAIMKGWIDRVFISGAFYGGRRVYGAGGMTGKKALVAFSLGGREHMFGKGAIHGELQSGMLRHFLQGTLGYVGLDVLEPFVAYNTPYIGEEARSGLLDALRGHVEQVEKLPILQMPQLENFDSTFTPRVKSEIDV